MDTSDFEYVFAGKLDFGESVEEAALRETWEESGFAESQLRLISGFRRDATYHVRGFNKRVTYFLAELVDPEAEVRLSREHCAFKWVTVEEAKQIANYRDIPVVIQAANEHMIAAGNKLGSR